MGDWVLVDRGRHAIWCVFSAPHKAVPLTTLTPRLFPLATLQWVSPEVHSQLPRQKHLLPQSSLRLSREDNFSCIGLSLPTAEGRNEESKSLDGELSSKVIK